ncbi:MAG: ABC transporter permease [Thermofilaceae archaeon]
MSTSSTFHNIIEIIKSITRYKKGVLGLFLLLTFILISIFADFIATHKPDEINLAEGYAVPFWFKAFPQYRDLPENIELKIVGSRWKVEGNCSRLTVVDDWILCEFTPESDERRVELSLIYSFEYPYSPPKGFYGEIAYNITVAGGLGSTARIRLYLDVPNGKSYQIYDSGAISYNLTRIEPSARFDARDVPLKLALGFSPYDDLGEKLFAEKGLYKLKIVIYSRIREDNYVKIAVSPLYFKIPGLAYGVLGTDNLGGDLFSNLIHGTRVSLIVGILASVVSVLLGLVVGIVAGYKGGLVDQILMFFTDTLMFLPLIPLLIAVSVFIGKILYITIFLIALFSWMGFAMNCIAYVMSLRERLFVEAARALGASDVYILFKHILPQLTPIVYITLVLNVPGAILLESSLSFLNLGDPRVPSWGRMLYNARYSGAFSRMLWWWVVPPGVMITLLAMSFVLIGQTLDEVFNPKLRARRLT